MNAITVRKATLGDLDSLASLFDAYRDFYGRPNQSGAARAFLRERLARAESTVFLAHDGSRAVGFAQLYPCFSSVSLARVFILNDLFVLEQCRRQGLGSRLLGAVIDYARAEGAVRVTLSTELGNRSAQALYRTVGWEPDTQFKVFHYVLDHYQEPGNSSP